MTQKANHPTTQYAIDVTKGDIVAGKFVHQACLRHLDDIKRDDIYFDEQAADRAIKWFDFLYHIKGEWAKPPAQTIKLEPWQMFITGNLFGWMREDGLRRFRTAYIEVARKNSKSTMAAGWAGYLAFMDNEPGAEVYSTGTTRDQAKIVFDTFQKMVKKSPQLRKKIQTYRNNLNIESSNSKFEPLSSDYNTLDGLNIHAAICDEVHQWPKRDLWDVIETATGSRQQPMQIGITTSGVDRAGICYEQHEYVLQILNRTIQDDTYFGIIYTIDIKEKEGKDDGSGDDWRDESIWLKANPNLGVSVKLDDLQRKSKKAKKIPAAQNNFKRKHLDIWTQQVNRWIDLDLWDSNYYDDIDETNLIGRLCYGGLDLSSVSDITAFIMLFPDLDDSDLMHILARLWCPESKLYDESNKYRDQYQAWVNHGYMEATEGDAIDYDYVKAQIIKDASTFKIDSLGVDRLFQGFQLSMQLEGEGIDVASMGMGYLGMAGPMNELESKLLKKKLNHGDNPVLRWMADNVAVSMDPAGNLKPNKASSQGKIDGIIGILLALDRQMRNVNKTSKYAEEGLTML